MSEKARVPIGSIHVFCAGCLHDKGWTLYEAITDTGNPQERYYASCRKCGFVLPLEPRVEAEV